MAVSIKEAGIADISKLSDIIRHAYKDVAQRFGLTPENCPKHPSNCTGEWVQNDLDRGVVYYVLEKDQEIRGCAALEKAVPNVCYLERLSILPQYRRKGLGTMLVHHILQEAHALGVPTVGIGIIAHQHELKKWYIELGFVEGETKSFDHLPFEVTFLSMNDQGFLMRYLKQKDFGEVQAFELGWSPMGRPAMTVHFYIKEMGLKENYLLKAFCMGNLSMKNMVRSAYVSLNPKVD